MLFDACCLALHFIRDSRSALLCICKLFGLSKHHDHTYDLNQTHLLQAVMHQLLSMGAVNSLPEDIQWAIRMLLPRKEETKIVASEAVSKPADALSQLVPATGYLPYMLQPQQLAALTQHAQQVDLSIGKLCAS